MEILADAPVAGPEAEGLFVAVDGFADAPLQQEHVTEIAPRVRVAWLQADDLAKMFGGRKIPALLKE